MKEAWLLDRYKFHGDIAARDELVERMMPLVRSVAGAYRSPAHAEDLQQVAALGLLKAVDRYDPSFGVPLRTYAMPTMYGEVRRFLRDHSWAVRPPRPLQERVLAVTKAIERLRARDGRAPTVEALASEVGCDAEDVLEALEAGRAHASVSLDAPASSGEEGDATLADMLGRDDAQLEHAEDVVSLRGLRHLLDDRDRQVLHLRFVEDLTQSEIARRIGVSQMQISRVIRAALARLSAAADVAV